MSDLKYNNVGTPQIKVIEECSELIKIICKGDRFGLDNYYPDRTSTNREEILNEIEDVMDACLELKKCIGI